MLRLRSLASGKTSVAQQKAQRTKLSLQVTAAGRIATKPYNGRIADLCDGSHPVTLSKPETDLVSLRRL